MFSHAHAIGAGLLALLFAAPAQSGVHVFHHENVLGTHLELRIRSVDAAAAQAAEARALAEIDRLNAILSSYDPDSELRRLQAAGVDPASAASPDLSAVLDASARWKHETGGAFDPAAESLTRLWKSAAAEGRVPSDGEIAEARRLMAAPGAPINVDGLAKGYIIDKACEAALNGDGVDGLLVNIGGDLRTAGGLAVRAGIANPLGDSESAAPIASVPLYDGAMATSGGYHRYTTAAGHAYSHIFDPRTGRPADRIVSATVTAPNAMEADALATAFNVLPTERSVALANRLDGVACLLVAADGTVTRSEGWRGPVPERLRLAQAETAEPAAGTWAGEFELAIDFEIANPAADGRYRRPYVGIWVCDHEGFPIRTLVLWIQHDGLRWLPDLKEWYRDDQIRFFVDETDLVAAMSRATRPPGKYGVVWDGKDDQGASVPGGVYTVVIEAVREHGTHASIRKELRLARTPFTEEWEGNVEVAAAAVAYRKIASE